MVPGVDSARPHPPLAADRGARRKLGERAGRRADSHLSVGRPRPDRRAVAGHDVIVFIGHGRFTISLPRVSHLVTLATELLRTWLAMLQIRLRMGPHTLSRLQPGAADKISGCT